MDSKEDENHNADLIRKNIPVNSTVGGRKFRMRERHLEVHVLGVKNVLSWCRPRDLGFYKSSQLKKIIQHLEDDIEEVEEIEVVEQIERIVIRKEEEEDAAKGASKKKK